MRFKAYWPAALLILVAGCNLDDSKATKKPAHAVHKTDSPTVKLVAIQPQDKPEAGQYCFVYKTYDKDGATYIDADYVQFLMGDAAIAAAKKKGEAEIVMDNYYIVNDNPQVRSLKLSSDFEFIVVENSAGSLDKKTAMTYLQSAIKNKWVLILTFNSQQEVIRIKEQFLP
jgi:hypothetical protein